MKNEIYQLNSVTNVQMNSYIITTSDDKVIVVDGGYRQDAENMIAYLKDITGMGIPHVDAWFLTHAHFDHIYCFVEIIEHHHEELIVDKILFNFPSAQYCLREGLASLEVMQNFLNVLPLFVEKTVTVFGGDVYDIGAAHIEILYSPNCEIKRNLVNNSSVIFMLTLNQKRILFLGDAGIEEGNMLLAYYQGTDKLKADYVQMAHHGQNGVEKEVYQVIRPSYCLWPTPSWLWENRGDGGYDTGIFNTVVTRGWISEMHCVKRHYLMTDGTQVIDLAAD